jgi:hypothetical protein
LFSPTMRRKWVERLSFFTFPYLPLYYLKKPSIYRHDSSSMVSWWLSGSCSTCPFFQIFSIVICKFTYDLWPYG